MAIRFQCGACAQPIEIDDEWARKTVACPYCRNTITAPASSTLSDLAAIPTASPVIDTQTAHPTTAAAAYAAPSAHPNRIAIVAAVFATCIVGFMIAMSLVLRAHAEDMRRLTELIQDQPSLSGMLMAPQKLAEEYGGVFPGWMIATSLLEVGAGLSWIAALVCGIIPARRPVRRAWGVGALLVCGLTPILFCCGGVITP